MSPAGLLQVLCQEQRSALITARRGADEAVVRVTEGLVFETRCGTDEGAAAVCRLMVWDGGQFHVEPAPVPALGEPLAGSWEELVLETARRRDEMLQGLRPTMEIASDEGLHEDGR
ncbi:MAG: hypothetical protein RLZZ387_5732 [Chloroflexota bacterium]